MPWRKKRTATFYDKEIFKTLPLDGTPTQGIVIDSTTVPVDSSSGRYVLEAGTIMCKVAAVAGTNQISNITIDATGGVFSVTITNPVTGVVDTVDNLAWNISAANLQVALLGLGNVAPGDLTVTKPGTPYVITFAGTYAARPVTVATSPAGLTGGAGTAAVTTPTPGVLTVAAGKARPAANSGEIAADILGILTHGVEFFYPVEAGITDEPAAVYHYVGDFDITQLVQYSGNAAAVKTAFPNMRFS